MEVRTALERADKILSADVYSQLSEFFKEPTQEFADDIASGRLIRFFRERLPASGSDSSLLDGLLLNGDVYAALKDEYRRLFFGPLPPYIVPVESVYKRWTNDPECRLPIASEKGYLMGDPAIDMIERYRRHGMVIPDSYSSMPDHITLELEYMAFLCGNAAESEQKEFLDSHMDWVNELTNDIKGFSGTNIFYSACIEAAQFLISCHKRALNGSC